MKRLLFSITVSLLLLPTLALAQGSPPSSSPTAPVTSGTITCDGTFNVADIFHTDGLLPPFLRTADSAQNADFSCIGAFIRFYVDFLALLISVVAFFYLLYGAFLYMTAFGDEAKAGQAKKVITQAVVGLVLAGLAYSIISIVNTALKAGAKLP